MLCRWQSTNTWCSCLNVPYSYVSVCPMLTWLVDTTLVLAGSGMT